MQEARSLIRTHLGDPQCGWGIGTFGAIAEFHRTPDEACHLEDLDSLTFVTARGGLQIDLRPGIKIVAYEGLSAYRQRWVHGLVFCLSHADGTGGQRACLTELGPDDAALRADDRASVLFDVGVGAPHLDACIRTSDPELLALLRRHVGECVVLAGHPVLRAIIAASPQRVFLSRLGRAEVYQQIATDVSPEGPHTHLFPKILGAGRTHASGIPLGKDALPCLWLFPPNPVFDDRGAQKPFDPVQSAAFQSLIVRYGVPEFASAKSRAKEALSAHRAPDSISPPRSRLERTAVRIALRQFEGEHGDSPLTRAWRETFDPTSETVRSMLH